MKIAVLMMEGYEESETMQIVDLLRRAEIEAVTFRFQEEPFVLSMQDMRIQSDAKFGPEVKGYDCLVVPGGRASWQKLIDSKEVLDMIRYFDQNHKFIAAMCSGTKVLQASGILKGRTVTGYTGYANVLTETNFVEAPVVRDDNLITSVGPATPYPFAFMIIDALGKDSSTMKKGLLYHFAGGK